MIENMDETKIKEGGGKTEDNGFGMGGVHEITFSFYFFNFSVRK